MEPKNLKTVPKITVKIWRPLLNDLEQRFEVTCLRRDAYLNRLLESEVGRLDNEISVANSAGAQAYVSRSLDHLDRKPVSLSLRPELVARLNEVCQHKRINRDSFFNRLFLMLAAGPKLIDDLFFQSAADEWKQEVWERFKHDATSWQSEFYPLLSQANPFWAIREGIEIYVNDWPHRAGEPSDSLYSRFIERKIPNGDLKGLNCYVPDWRVPGSDAQRAREHLDDILLQEV